jgi:hypothetical protein
MLVCNYCGKLKEETELERVTEMHGETHLDTYCHRCDKGEFVTATKCEFCGEWFDDDSHCGICESCMDDEYTVGNALEYGEGNLVSVDGINEAIATLLTPEEMNRILGKWVEENFVDGSNPVRAYLDNDKSAFAEFLLNR